MQQTNYIKSSSIEELKKQVQELYDSQETVNVLLKKSRNKGENHDVVIDGVYKNFFTVKSNALHINFTIQYVDVIMGNIVINKAE